MTPREFAARLEQAFGYPLSVIKPLVARLAASHLEVDEPKEHEVALGYLISDNVHWEGEFHEGPSPALLARQLQFELLGRPVPSQPMPAQAAQILARHFCGLLAFEQEVSLNPEGAWLIDLNPRRDGSSAPIYFEAEGKLNTRRGYLFGSVSQFVKFKQLVHDLEEAEADEDPKRQARVAQQMQGAYPHAVELFGDYLRDYGVKAAVPPSVEDADGQRLFGAYAAFLPIADVLIARARGKKAARLPAAAAHQCDELIAAAPEYPPHALMSMLVPALSGNMDEARQRTARASNIPKAPALLQRWGALIQKGLPPFD